MTNKEFFINVLKDEAPRFRKALDALPEDKHKHKVHDKSREAGNLAGQIAIQWKAISGIIKNGSPDFDPHEMEGQSKSDMLKNFDEGVAQLLKDTASVSDEAWENDEATVGPEWTTKKYDMAWGFLFDAIHHRGQLSTYLRNMGEKVPSIYGPSADVAA